MMMNITIPNAQTLVAEGHVFDYSLPQFLAEQVWPAPYWRDGDVERFRAWSRMIDRFDGCIPGDVVSIIHDDHAHLVIVATMRGRALPPAAAVSFCRLMMPIVCATEAA